MGTAQKNVVINNPHHRPNGINTQQIRHHPHPQITHKTYQQIQQIPTLNIVNDTTPNIVKTVQSQPRYYQTTTTQPTQCVAVECVPINNLQMNQTNLRRIDPQQIPQIPATATTASVSATTRTPATQQTLYYTHDLNGQVQQVQNIGLPHYQIIPTNDHQIISNNQINVALQQYHRDHQQQHQRQVHTVSTPQFVHTTTGAPHSHSTAQILYHQPQKIPQIPQIQQGHNRYIIQSAPSQNNNYVQTYKMV